MKKITLWGIGLIVVGAWASLVIGMQLEIEDSTWFAWVAGVAILTEIAVWTVAAVLGVAIVQARRDIWNWLKRPFKRTSARD